MLHIFYEPLCAYLAYQGAYFLVNRAKEEGRHSALRRSEVVVDSEQYLV